MSWSLLTFLANPTAPKAPWPSASGEISNCLSWVHVDTERSYAVMLDNLDLIMSEFYQMNPSVGSDFSNLSLGSFYYIRTTASPVIDGKYTYNAQSDIYCTTHWKWHTVPGAGMELASM